MNKIAAIHVVIAFFTVSGLAALTEVEYRAKYPFTVDRDPGLFTSHPSGRYRVFTQFGVRECDLEEGNVKVLAFYDGKTLLRSYSLEQLFPDRDAWQFHPASGVFLWIIFAPDLNGFHGEKYTVVTVSGIRTFSMETGDPVETPPSGKEQVALPPPQ